VEVKTRYSFSMDNGFRHFRRAILIFLHGNDSDFPSFFREFLMPKENRNFTSTNSKQSKLSDVTICLGKKKKIERAFFSLSPIYIYLHLSKIVRFSLLRVYAVITFLTRRCLFSNLPRNCSSGAYYLIASSFFRRGAFISVTCRPFPSPIMTLHL